jgi:radical SAM family uncharacterized protein
MTKTYKNILYDEILPRVSKPGQYAGGERNVIIKDHKSVDLKIALAFPDTYGIGMSHLGMKILYHMLNAREDMLAERVFAPWVDMESQLRSRGLALRTLETFTPLEQFDVVGFSMQYELSYTNFLNMLEMGGITPLTSDRGRNEPVILGGGAVASAMEPVAPFFDAILIGDVEDVLYKIMDAIKDWRRGVEPRASLHRALAAIPGTYVPSLYEVTYKNDGTIERIQPNVPAPTKVAKTTVKELETAPFPVRPVVPNVEIIHDRINVEIMRGCPHQCRFCQAVKHYRPLKKRSIPRIIELAEETFKNTGYDEISLTSLSTADYPGILDLVNALAVRFGPRRVNVSLPSLRVGPELSNLPLLAGGVRKTGLTMAPEVATDRLRSVIRKRIKNEHLIAGCRAAFEAGYRLIKFYFMIGAPGETDTDLDGIIGLINDVSLLRKQVAGKRAQINASISSFIPKPHTPFQWEAMNERAELRTKQDHLKSLGKSGYLRLKFHDVDVSYFEAVFSRGDRRLASTLLKAREMGLRMDSWEECFDSRRWHEAFEESSLDHEWYALRERGAAEILPWDMIGLAASKDHLFKEKLLAQAEV